MKALMVLLTVMGVANQVSAEDAVWPDPGRFEGAISKYKAQDRASFPPKGAVVCIGSSSMRGWHGAIREDLAPLTVIPRGFGGSNMNDVLYFADRVVLPYKPRAILLYEGDNDIAKGLSPETVMATFDSLVAKVHATLPETRFYVLAVKPSIRRWEIWPEMQEVNRLMQARCATDERLTYIDIATPMLNEDGQPKADIFKDDDLHMNRKGYVIWRDAVRPVLVEKERGFEE